MFTEHLPGFFKICGNIAEDVSKSYQDGGAFLVLHHRVEVVLDMPTFNNFFGTSIIKRNLGEQSCNVKTKFLSLTETWIEKDVT